MRAISLDGSLVARIKSDEARYTLSEAGMRFAEMGYNLVRSPHGPWGPSQPLEIAAELQTACGCTKRIFLPRKNLAHSIRHAIYPGMRAVFMSPDEQVTVTATIREFRFWQIEDRDGLPVAIYREHM